MAQLAWLAGLCFGCGSSRAFDDSALGGAFAVTSGGVSNSQGGVGGSASAGAASGGAQLSSAGGAPQGGVAGALSAGAAGAALSKTAACLAYANAVCARSYECANAEPDLAYCLQQVGGTCPDLVFSPGSNRTVEEALQCADVFRALPCHQLDGARPACVTPGALKIDAPCRFASQCETLSCLIVDGSTCGKCARLAARGEPCGTAVALQCAAGSRCSRVDSGICFDATPVPMGGSCKAAFCDVGLVCSDDVCVGPAGLDEPCPVGLCKPGLSCVSSGDVPKCVVVPIAGQPCPSGVCETFAYCDTNEPTPTCRALPAAGQPCQGMACDRGLRCVTSPVPVCAAPLQRGATCVVPTELTCVAGTACMCRDAQCSARTCAVPGVEGAPCGTPDNACHAAFECVNGSCRTREGDQGLFHAACGL